MNAIRVSDNLDPDQVRYLLYYIPINDKTCKLSVFWPSDTESRHWRHCVVSLSKNINPSLVLVQPRKISPFITERLLMGCKESNQTNKLNKSVNNLSALL